MASGDRTFVIRSCRVAEVNLARRKCWSSENYGRTSALISKLPGNGAPSLYLYGSVSTGQARRGRSDVDLLTVGIDPTTARKIGAQLSERFSDWGSLRRDPRDLVAVRAGSPSLTAAPGAGQHCAGEGQAIPPAGGGKRRTPLPTRTCGYPNPLATGSFIARDQYLRARSGSLSASIQSGGQSPSVVSTARSRGEP